MDWAGPFRPKIFASRAVSAKTFCGTGCFSPIFRHFLKEQFLILNELIIRFKFSLKHLLKIRMEMKLCLTGPKFLRAGPLRPEISHGPAQRFRTLLTDSNDHKICKPDFYSIIRFFLSPLLEEMIRRRSYHNR